VLSKGESVTSATSFLSLLLSRSKAFQLAAKVEAEGICKAQMVNNKKTQTFEGEVNWRS